MYSKNSKMNLNLSGADCNEQKGIAQKNYEFKHRQEQIMMMNRRG